MGKKGNMREDQDEREKKIMGGGGGGNGIWREEIQRINLD